MATKIKSKTKKVATPKQYGKTSLEELNPSIGNISKSDGAPEKTSGIKMRGAGAATKGTMCRGPMG